MSLSASEWCMMSELIQILQPLEEATWELSTEQKVSCSKVIPLLNVLLLELRKNIVDNDETQVPDDDETQVPESQGSSVPSLEESQQVVAGLIASIEYKWLNYEEDRIYSICTLLDPTFTEVCFTNAALVRAKRLLLSIMRAIRREDLVASSTSVVNDDEEDVPIKKKNSHCETVSMNSKRRNQLIYQLIKTKMRKNRPYTAVRNTLRERRIL